MPNGMVAYTASAGAAGNGFTGAKWWDPFVKAIPEIVTRRIVKRYAPPPPPPAAPQLMPTMRITGTATPAPMQAGFFGMSGPELALAGAAAVAMIMRRPMLAVVALGGVAMLRLTREADHPVPGRSLFEGGRFRPGSGAGGSF